MAELDVHRAHRVFRSRRGSSFVEVLLAMTIMALVLVGILQMFSVALIINKGSAARTQMLFKCQQVVENLRWYYYVTQHSFASPLGTGIPPLGANAVNLPYTAAELVAFPFWGPAGANVMEAADGPYKIRYVIEQDAAQSVAPLTTWVITVTAYPTDVAGATRYFGISTTGSGKRVDYVAQYVQ
ncbi:MAG: hypothetical protein NEA02_03040 [Thermoanaerobaculia bacterium]|nr:hypothetical protein [Thermoanaerobaculia bacterium]